MSSVLEGGRQLAAPVSVLLVPPALLDCELEVDLDPEVDSTPGHLQQARRLVAAWPQSPAALVRLAQAELAVGDVDSAIATSRSAAGFATRQDWLTQLAAARVLVACGQRSLAEAILVRLGRGEEPVRVMHASLAAQRDDVETAMGLLSRVDSFEGLSMKAWLLLRRQSFSEAIHLYRAALRVGNATPGVLANLGYAHSAIGARPAAIRETLEAFTRAPSSRLIGLNLVSYFVAAGRRDDALDVIRSLREFHSDDIRLVFAEAAVFAQFDDLDRAYRTLRRARTAYWAYASDADQVELVSNLAHLEWQLGKRTRESAGDAILEELKIHHYASADTARLLSSILTRRGDVNRVAEAIDGFRQAHPEDPLYPLRVRHALLRDELESATDLALQWASDDIFDAGAASVATYLLVDVRADFLGAVEFARKALTRVVSIPSLVNNYAYALALSGDLDSARRAIARLEDTHFVATRALIDMQSGRIDAGLEGYDKAYEDAIEGGNADVANLVLLYRGLALVRAGRATADEIFADPRLPSSVLDEPDAAVIEHAARLAARKT